MGEILLNVTRSYFNRIVGDADYPIRGRTSAFGDYHVILFDDVPSMLEDAPDSSVNTRLILAEIHELRELFSNRRSLEKNLHFIYSGNPNEIYLSKMVRNVLDLSTNSHSSLHCRISGVFSETENLLNCALGFLRQLHKVSSEVILMRISLVLREVIANAILHGNKSDCSKNVELSLIVDGNSNKLFVEVSDEGKDCDLQNIYRRTEPSHEARQHGIDIIHHFSSNVHANGSTLRIEFEL